MELKTHLNSQNKLSFGKIMSNLNLNFSFLFFVFVVSARGTIGNSTGIVFKSLG